MSKRNRASQLKRQREADRRERQRRKAAKAAAKRERRSQKKDGESQIAPGEDVQDNAGEPGLPTATPNIDQDETLPDSGRSGYGTAAP